MNIYFRFYLILNQFELQESKFNKKSNFQGYFKHTVKLKVYFLSIKLVC